jgi:hypothetical protein
MSQLLGKHLAEGAVTSTKVAEGAISAMNKIHADIKNVANGLPVLDAQGKILASQLPNSIMEYKGMWDATSGVPSATPNAGDVYRVSVAGTFETVGYEVGDYIIYSGTAWEKADNSDNEIRNDLASVANGQGASLVGVEAGTFTATTVQGVVVELHGDIASEVTNRTAAITSAISTEVIDRNAAVSAAISTEVIDRNAAVSSAISTEVVDRNSAINVEATNRMAADLAEVTARNAAISVVVGSTQALVQDEASARVAGDLAEVTARDSAISVEVTNRTAAIASAISTEVIDRNAAVSSAISTEVIDRNAAISSALALAGGSASSELITLDAGMITAKAFDLAAAPTDGASIVLFPLGGLPQSFGDDFGLSGVTVSWNGLGMDSLGLAAGDKIRVIYFVG